MLAIRMQEVVFLIFVLWTELVHSNCEFPVRWQGQWYSGNLGEVRILPRNLTPKGVCLENSTHFYLIHDREIDCYSCMKIIERHHNILQYQESYCGGDRSLKKVCRHLNTAVWNTLIRENPIAVSCPFKHAYHFSYNNNTGGFCREPKSFATPCSRDSHYKLHFKQCPIRIASYTYDRVVHLECIGEWKFDNQLLMVGKLNSTAFPTKQQQYRCFIYEKTGTVMYMAMSDDAACFGLQSPKSGPTRLEMIQDKFGWPDTTCEFPRWMTRYNWRDLDGTHTYSFNKNTSKMYMASRLSINSTSSIVKAFRCINKVHAGVNQLVLLSFTSRQCLSHYQCLQFIERRDGVIELREGKTYSYEPRKCQDENFNDALKKTLIDERAFKQKCPLPGKRLIRTGTDVCRSYFRIGCNGSSVIDIISSCSSKPGIQLNCLKTWKENKQTYVVARKADVKDGPANCFVIRHFIPSSTAQFTVDPDCNVDTSYILKDSISYTMAAKPEECDKIVPQPDNNHIEVSIDNNNRVNEQFQKDSQYVRETNSEQVKEQHRTGLQPPYSSSNKCESSLSVLSTLLILTVIIVPL